MSEVDLVVGVLRPPAAVGNEELAEKLRDLTIACCRFDFSGPLLESDSVDDLLEQAAETGARHALIQSHGHAMVRLKDAARAIDTNFIKAIRAWLPDQDFFVAGEVRRGEGWYGLDELCFVVHLEDYRRFHKPRFSPTIQGPLPTAREVLSPEVEGGKLLTLEPAGGRAHAQPDLPGWGLVAASLENGKPVVPLAPLLHRCRYDLRPRTAADTETYLTYRGDGIFRYDETNGVAPNADWRGFLHFVKDQARHAKKGVFLGNWESYADVETPPAGFQGPVSAVYGVSAGFKVNRILHTHGMADSSRVFNFDYSPVALGIKEAQVKEWDGSDYPAFIERVSERFPEAFYQLWGLWGAPRPGALNLDMVRAIWAQEIEVWGGEASFQEHWQRFRTLEHRFIHCDLFAHPEPLLEAIVPDPGAILWWSNAFHSLNGVWFYSRAERQGIYRRWLEALARVNPDLWLYGKDVDNLEIGGTQLRQQLDRAVGE